LFSLIVSSHDNAQIFTYASNKGSHRRAVQNDIKKKKGVYGVAR
jgi:hypothetical protein